MSAGHRHRAASCSFWPAPVEAHELIPARCLELRTQQPQSPGQMAANQALHSRNLHCIRQ